MQKVYISFFIIIFFCGCVQDTNTTDIHKGDLYPRIYVIKPKSILVLPAINHTTSSIAPEIYAQTISKPLIEQGYYVFSPMLVDKFLKSENLYEPNIINNIPIQKLRDVFGCDAIMYIEINSWDTVSNLLTSTVSVEIVLRLVNAKDGDTLFTKYVKANITKGITPTSTFAMLTSILSTISNATTDYQTLAIICNNIGLADIPSGIYKGEEHYLVDAKNKQKLITKNKKIDAGKLYVTDISLADDQIQTNKKYTIDTKGIEGLKVASAYNLSSYEQEYVNINIENFANTYYIHSINDHPRLKNEYFFYDAEQKPFLIIGTQVVYIQQNLDGTIPIHKDNIGYFFNIENVLDLEHLQKIKF